MNEQHIPICMAEEYWAYSYFSIAKYYGGCKIGSHFYKVVNKEGVTIQELSDPNSKHYVGDGDKKAIEPGEPADLIREDFIPYYRELGRDRFIGVLEKNQRVSTSEIMEIYKEMIKGMKDGKEKNG